MLFLVSILPSSLLLGFYYYTISSEFLNLMFQTGKIALSKNTSCYYDTHLLITGTIRFRSRSENNRRVCNLLWFACDRDSATKNIARLGRTRQTEEEERTRLQHSRPERSFLTNFHLTFRMSKTIL